VHHLLEHPDLFPVSSGPEWFAGLLRLPHNTVAAVDLRRYFGLSCNETPGSAIAVQLPHATVEFAPLAFLVDRLLTTEHIRPSEIRPLRANQGQPHFRSCSIGSWRRRSRPCYILSLQKLLPPEELDLVRAWVHSSW
jgi:chemotaxis signal transduction protein